MLSTHIDCVPPFFPSRVADGVLYGRGACDAKGALAAQVMAAERLREAGQEKVGLLFVVGEERGSDGALAANELPPGARFLVNGEPTGSRLGLGDPRRPARQARGHGPRGALVAAGAGRERDRRPDRRARRAAADPAAGRRALGRTFYSIGLISGGIAPNVISPSAEAELLFRTVGPGKDVLDVPGPARGARGASSSCSRSRP